MSNTQRHYESEFLIEADDEAEGYRPGASSGLLRLVLLFGSAVVALTLVIVPILSDKANKHTAQSLFPQGVDYSVTGSISKANVAVSPQAYVDRKSELPLKP